MKAAIYPGKGQPITIETLPDPEPGPDDVIIRVHRCGICGTDLSMTKGEMWDYGAGSQLGHEYAGEIVALGKNASGFRLGDKIAVNPSGACGNCAGCAGGNNVMCRTGVGAMHGFAEFARVPVNLAVKLPDTLSMADGALIEPLAVSLYGVRQSGITKGANVVILGGGTVALYAIYWARRMGAGRIVAMSRSERRRDMCLAMGADVFILFGEGEVGAVTDALGGPPSLVYECVGSPGMMAKALQHVAIYGKIVSLGFCTQPDPFMPAMAAYKCATMQFLVGYTRDEFYYIADQMDKDHIDPKTIITSTAPLDALPQTFSLLRSDNAETKVHIAIS
jgi:threonine dehydrogenase-like Zn-dependent dehydrogenase